MAFGAIAVGAAVVSAGAKIYGANQAANAAEDQANEAKAVQEKEQAALDKQMQEYKSQKFTNPYENMENVFEDLTVNQQQAQFQAQQGSQQRANIMQNLRGAAGSSGVAGLAQTLANQGQLQTQQISASIGQQESKNQFLKAQQAGKIQTAQREGEAMVQQAEMSRQKTLLGMQQADTAAATQASNAAKAQQMQAEQGVTDAWVSGISNVASAGVSYGKEFMSKGGEDEPDIDWNNMDPGPGAVYQG